MATLVTLQQQQRQGSFQTGSHVVPADARGTLIVRPQIDAGDFTDTSKTVWMRLYRFDAPSQVWVQVVSARWFAQADGNHSNPDEHPSLSTAIEPLRGQQIRGEVDIPSRMRVGCIVELI